MTTIEKYKNGNYDVELFDDGTKIRTYDDVPNPELPESIDLKITDYCDLGCSFCHESSTTKGTHALSQNIFDILKESRPGMEVAIGGGNPFSHPLLFKILEWIKSQKLIANITINAGHLINYSSQINYLRHIKYIYGVGISYKKDFEDYIKLIWDSNCVIHLICGIHRPRDLIYLFKNWGFKKFLLLGYKTYGRGKYKAHNVENIIGEWYYWIGSLAKLGASISFDNLAIEQLDIKSRMTPEKWNELYCGDEGKFTMYIDAVGDKYGVNSFGKRFPRNNKGLREIFQNVRN